METIIIIIVITRFFINYNTTKKIENNFLIMKFKFIYNQNNEQKINILTTKTTNNFTYMQSNNYIIRITIKLMPDVPFKLISF